MRISLLVSGVAVLLACRPAMAQAQIDSARLRGAVVDEANRPVAGARVTLVREAQAVGGASGKWRNTAAPAVSQAVSDLAGNFLLTRLSAARYDVCIEAPGYLTTCEREQLWTEERSGSLGPPSSQFVLKTLRDCCGPSAAFPFHSWVFAIDSGVFTPPGKLTTEGSTHTFQVEAPYETQLAVRVHSARYHLRDAQSRAIGLYGGDTPFQVRRGSTPPTFTFVVSGEISQPAWPPVGVRPPGTARP